MPADGPILSARIERLERSLRRTQLLAAAAGAGLLLTWLAAARSARSVSEDTVRTKLLIVQDSQGRDRIVFGAPMPDGRQYVGMKILDPAGAEQFGLSLNSDASVSMGFDTRPGVGDPRNRERLNMGVTAAGEGWIRYLDNQTRVRMWVRLDSTGSPTLQFLDWPDKTRIRVRQVGFRGDTILEWKR
jgi:hypothetical protein